MVQIPASGSDVHLRYGISLTKILTTSGFEEYEKLFTKSVFNLQKSILDHNHLHHFPYHLFFDIFWCHPHLVLHAGGRRESQHNHSLSTVTDRKHPNKECCFHKLQFPLPIRCWFPKKNICCI